MSGVVWVIAAGGCLFVRWMSKGGRLSPAAYVVTFKINLPMNLAETPRALDPHQACNAKLKMPSRPYAYLLNKIRERDVRMRIIEQGLKPQAEHRKTVCVRSERALVRDSQIDNEQAGRRVESAKGWNGQAGDAPHRGGRVRGGKEEERKEGSRVARSATQTSQMC